MSKKKVTKSMFFHFIIFLIFFSVLMPFLIFRNNFYVIMSNSMSPNLNIGDLIFIQKKKISNIEVGFPDGDILVIRGPNYYYENGLSQIFFNNLKNNTPIIHRAIDKKNIDNKSYFLMKGDNNFLVDGGYKIANFSEDLDSFIIEYNKSDAIYVCEDEILGVYVFKIPFIGYIKIFFPYLLIFISFLVLLLICFKLAGYRIKIVKIES